MSRLLPLCVVVSLGFSCAQMCAAQDLHVPESTVAGHQAVISTTGSGKAILYLIGPGVSRKSEITLGEDVQLPPEDLRNAGGYLAILCAGTCRDQSFYVTAAKPASLTFLVHPSRVPVTQEDAVSGVAFPFDQYRNLVLAPESISFQLTAKDASLWSHASRTQNGVAWFRTTSGKSAGPVQVTAVLGDLTSRRALQQVASDPCNLRISGQRTRSGILVQTEPVHDCAGNPVSDGTIVTFTETGANGTDTVDAPIKHGIARAQLEAPGAVAISVASGVVMGNEIHVGGQP